jgi:hypothetical protein
MTKRASIDINGDKAKVSPNASNSDGMVVFSHYSSGYKQIIWSRFDGGKSIQLLLSSPIIAASSPFMQ